LKSLSIFLIGFALTFPLFAQDHSEHLLASHFKRSGELRYHMLLKESGPDTTQPVLPGNNESLQLKKPGVGILLSAAIPGAGQVYTGHWKRGLIYFGVEVAMWITYFSQKDKGEDLKTVFRAYADTHWSTADYHTWLLQNPTFKDTTHSLPDTKTQQYYEMIGKYNQFRAGWDDWEEGDPALTPNRDHYETMRDKSNKYLIRASYVTMIAFANHVISAFDAAFTIRKLNRKIEGKMQVRMSGNPDQLMPVLALHLCW